MAIKGNNLWMKFQALLIYVPAFLAFGVVFLLGRPTYNVVKEICQNWETVGGIESNLCLSGKNLPGAFGTLHWNVYHAVSFTWAHFGDSAATLFLVLLILGLLTFYYLSKITQSRLKIFMNNNNCAVMVGDFLWYPMQIGAKFYLLPALVALPLYGMGIDYGRWFAVTSINYAIIVLFRGLSFLEFENSENHHNPLRYYLANSRVIKHMDSKPGSKLWLFTEWLLLFFVIISVRLPHCCATDVSEFLGGLLGDKIRVIFMR